VNDSQSVKVSIGHVESDFVLQNSRCWQDMLTLMGNANHNLILSKPPSVKHQQSPPGSFSITLVFSRMKKQFQTCTVKTENQTQNIC